MRALAIVILLVVPQDSSDKVRALVEKLGSDVIAEREAATSELIKLGPAALPAIREQLGKADGERKARLQAVVKRIEREIKLEKLLGAVPVVTLKVRDVPVEEALAEISSQTGLSIEGFFLDRSFRTTADFKRVSVWKAVDDLCRSHGGIIGVYRSNGIVVEPGQPDAPPILMDKGFGFLVRRAFKWEDGRVELQAVLAHPPRLPLWSTRLEFEALEDDQGTSLVAEKVEPQFLFGSRFVGQTRPGQFAVLMSHVSAAGAAEGAKRLARVRGRILVGLALDLKPLVILSDPLKEEKSSAKANGYAVEIKSVLKGAVIRLRVAVQLPKGEKGGGPGWTLALRDNGGELHMGRVVADLFEDDDVTVEVAVPEGRTIASFELLEPEGLTEVRIPFDFADIPIRAK